MGDLNLAPKKKKIKDKGDLELMIAHIDIKGTQ